MGDGEERVLLCSTQFQLGNNMADRGDCHLGVPSLGGRLLSPQHFRKAFPLRDGILHRRVFP